MTSLPPRLNQDWVIGTQLGRWTGFGPYYAMFPVSFARQMIATYSKPGETVVDPFCGRGTSLYVAKALGRESFGCELNPVGWIYAKTKVDPARRPERLRQRIRQLYENALPDDWEAENDFQEWAFSPDVLAFINSCRRSLNWKESKIDRTVAAFLLVYLHGKAGGAMSNQMRQSKSMAPDYAVRWWKENKKRPPELDPVKYLTERIAWRYQKGLWQKDVRATVFLGDCRSNLRRYRGARANLVLTSPPYMGITNYEYDNWIRLWALGGPSLPSWKLAQRYANRERFKSLMSQAFMKAREVCTNKPVVVVRTDSRRFTLECTAESVRDAWPKHVLYAKRTVAQKPTQTALFGDGAKKPGEVDLIALPRERRQPSGFINLLEVCESDDE